MTHTYVEDEVRSEDRGYYERREQLYLTLRCVGFATVAELVHEFGGTPHEITAKLQSLRRAGLVYYEPPDWHVVEP